MMLPEMKAAIFDLDGVLLDSMDIWIDVDKEFFEMHGMDYTPEISKHLSTLNMEQGAKYMINDFNLDLTVDEVMKQLLDIVMDMYLHDIDVKPGVIELLQIISDQGIPICLATSNTHELVGVSLKAHGLEHFFKAVVTCNDVGAGKWSTKVYDRCCEIMDADIAQTYVFEDSLHAIATLNESDYITVGVYDSYSEAEQYMIEEISDVYVKDLNDFIKKVKI